MYIQQNDSSQSNIRQGCIYLKLSSFFTLIGLILTITLEILAKPHIHVFSLFPAVEIMINPACRINVNVVNVQVLNNSSKEILRDHIRNDSLLTSSLFFLTLFYFRRVSRLKSARILPSLESKHKEEGGLLTGREGGGTGHMQKKKKRSDDEEGEKKKKPPRGLCSGVALRTCHTLTPFLDRTMNYVLK